jgi:hypothetical protein
MLSHSGAPVRRWRLPVLLAAAAALLGGCVYDPYSGTYAPGVAAAPAYGYYPGYYPGYAYGGPSIVIGGDWGHGWHDHDWHGGGWHH